MIDPLVGSAVVGGLANVAGGFMNNAFNSRQSELAYNRQVSLMREQNNFNAEQARIARDYNTAERLSAQAYNSPSAQVSRLRAAGINGQSVSPAVSSPASSSPASASGLPQISPFRSDPINLGQPLQDLVQGSLASSSIAKNAADVARDLRELGLKTQDLDLRKQSLELAKNVDARAAQMHNKSLALADEQLKTQAEETLSKQLYNKWYETLAAHGMDIQDKQADAALKSISAQFAAITTNYKIAMLQSYNDFYKFGHVSAKDSYEIRLRRREIDDSLSNNLRNFWLNLNHMKLDWSYKKLLYNLSKDEFNLNVTRYRENLLGRTGLGTQAIDLIPRVFR